MFIFTYTAAFLTLVFLALAAFIFIKKRRDPLGQFLLLHLVADAVWIGSNAAADVASTKQALIFWSGMALIGASFFASFFLCFIDTFAYHRRPKISLLAAYIFPSVIFSILAFSKYSIVETFFPPGQPAEILPGIIYKIFPFFHFGSLIYGVIRSGIIYKTAAARRKLQIIYLEIGFMMLIIGGAVFDALLPFFGELRFFSVGPQFSIFLAGFSIYAVLKHQLLDIKIVIQRGLIYTVLLICSIGFYIVTVGLLGYLLESRTNTAIFVGAGLTTLAGIFGVPVIEKYFRRTTDKVFFKDKYDYELVMQELSEILNQNLDLKRLLERITTKLKQLFRVERAELFLVTPHAQTPLRYYPGTTHLPAAYLQATRRLLGKSDIIIRSEIPDLLKDDGLENWYRDTLSKMQEFATQLDMEVIAPVALEKDIRGILLLSKKLSGDAFTDQDLRLLKTFACQAAVALSKAELYETVKTYSQELETKVKERTEQLRGVQEEQKQMMIDISHGLQTPLTVVKGQLGFLGKRGSHNKHLDAFEKSIDEISRFIYDLLSLAALEITPTNSKKEPVNMSSLAHELIEYFRVLAEEEKIIIVDTIEPGYTMPGDKEQLRQLVTNLVSNAFKYMAPGREKKITIALRKLPRGLELIVEDTGTGISSEDLSKIFNRFYRVKNSNRAIKGTGLGLAISKKIVDNHDGTIVVESVLDRGTKFTVTFPGI